MAKRTQRPPFGQTLYTLRRAAGLTQEAVALQLGLDRSSYTYYETGVSTPTIDNLKQLANIFGVSSDYLLNLENRTNDLVVQEEVDLPDAVRALSGLTKDEKALLMCYRRMSADEKAAMMRTLLGDHRSQD